MEIDGVTLRRLEPQRDERGELVELCRHIWVEPEVPVQWNLVANRGHVLRGIHWHDHHTDHIAPVFGGSTRRWSTSAPARPPSWSPRSWSSTPTSPRS